MQLIKSRIILTASFGLLFLGACSSGNQTTSSGSSPAASPPAESKPIEAPTETTKADSAPMSSDGHGGQDGQVIESGPYHLELVTAKESEGVHLDFFLQKGDNHEAIPNANVTAQVQLPDGSQQTLDFKYDAGEKHYTAMLPGVLNGEAKVAILSDINGEKVNGRFTVK